MHTLSSDMVSVYNYIFGCSFPLVFAI